jgi:hypothetical protein
MKDILTDDLKPAAAKILNCFRERGLRTGEMIGHWDFGDAVIWEKGFIRDEEVRQGWGELTSKVYVHEADAALVLAERGEQLLYGSIIVREGNMTEPSYEELKAQLEALKAKEARSGTMSFKVSDKGGVSVYGLGRFPVTLYYEQWIKLLDRAQDLREFLESNKDKLKLKE